MTLNAAAILISTPAGAYQGSWSLSTDGTTATFTPATPFPDFAQVNVKVTTAIRDRVGRLLRDIAVSGFQTTDSVPPVIVSASPPASATGVLPSAVVRVGYSEAVNPAAFSGAAIDLRLNGSSVAGVVSFVLNNSVAVFTPSVPLQPNSSYDVLVRPAADMFGNLQAQGSSHSFSTLDTLAPVIQALVADPPSAFEGSAVAVSAQIADPSDVASVEFLLNGTVISTDALAPFQALVPVTTALRPSFSVSARASDRSGNISGPATITIDVQSDAAPTAAIVSPLDGTTVNTGGAVTLRVRGTDDRGVSRIAFQTSGQVSIAGFFTVNPPAVTQDATFTIQIPASASPGPLTIRAAATDAGGASSPTASIAMTVVDATLPTVQIVSPAQGTGVDAGQTVSLVATAGDNGGIAAISIEVTGATVFSATRTITPPATAAQASFEIPVPSSTPDGQSLNVTIRARDAAGNDSLAVSRSFAVVVPDTTLPVVTTLATASGSLNVQAGESVSLRASVTDNVGVTALTYQTEGALVTDNTVPVVPALTSGSVVFSIQVPAAAAVGSSIAVRARARDAAGNLSDPVSIVLTVVDGVAPTVLISAPAAEVEIDPRAPLSVTIQASDAVGVTEITLTASFESISGSETRTITPPATTRAETFTVTFAELPRMGGRLMLGATARDAAGNTGTAVAVLVNVRDVVAPDVAAVTPPDGASGVDPQTAVVVQFTEPMDAETLTPENLTLSRDGTPEPMDILIGDGGQVATLTPENRPLPLNALFTLTIGTGVTDRVGNPLSAIRTTTFRTAQPDVIPPRVQNTNPAAGAVGVGLTTFIDVTFSEPIDIATVTPQSFRVSVGGVPVAGAFSFLNGNVLGRFLPAAPFATEAVVVVELTSAIADVAGNPLADANGQPLGNPFTFTFLTGSFGIVHPAAGSAVVENSTIVIEARASATLGVASVVFTVNGQALPAIASAPFVTPFSVPPVASRSTLTIVASARNAQGAEVASDSRTLDVVVGLRVAPALVGIPLGGGRTLRFSVSSPLAGSLPIQLRAGDSTVVSFPVNPVVIPAGQSFVDAAVTGQATGNTAVFGDSSHGTTEAIVSVSQVVAGRTLTPTASLVGAAFLNPPSAGVVTITTDVVPVWQPLAGLTSWWRADGNALDAVGTNHGTLQNGAGFATGKFGQAFSFDGVDDQIVVPPNANLNAGTAITIAAWVNPTSIGHGRPIAQKRSSGNVGGYTFETTANGLQWIVWINGAHVTLQTPPDVLQAGVWRHVAATYDGAWMKIFVDGTLRASLSITGAVDNSIDPVVIGRNVVVSGFAWHGLLDEVEIYQRPLDAGEILALARRGTPDPAGQTRTVDVVVLSAPAATATNVSVTSSNPAVATATSGPIAAGSQTARVSITAGQSGTAILIVRAGNETRSVTIVVGGSAPPGIPYLFARPVGLSLLAPASAGMVTITSDVVPVWQPLAGLTSWWRADGDVLDAVGTNHGTLQNGAGFATGKFGQAFSFDGVDDQIVVPPNANLNAGTAITIAAWVNPTSIGHGRPIAQKRSSGNVGGYTFETTKHFGPDDGLQWLVWINGGPQTLQTPPNVLQPGVWHHVAATYDGASMKIFVDGTLRASLAVAGTVDGSTEPFVIGRNVVVPSFAWHGLIDEVEVYQRPLGAAEIEALARRGTPDPAGLTRAVDVLLLSAPAATATNVSVTSSNPAVATATSGPIAMGSRTATLSITTVRSGTTVLIVRAGTETRRVTIVVGDVSPPGGIPYLFAKPVGLSLLAPASIGGPRPGEIFAPTAAARAIRVRVLAVPATTDTPVAITSSDPAIATAASPAIVHAGEQTVDLDLSTSGPGRATLTLTVNGDVLTLDVSVGIEASPGKLPLVSGAPVGISVVRAGSAGQVIAPEGVVSLPTLKIPLLASPVAAPVQVTVTSGTPSIVSIGGLVSTTVTIAQGEQTIDVPLSIAGIEAQPCCSSNSKASGVNCWSSSEKRRIRNCPC